MIPFSVTVVWREGLSVVTFDLGIDFGVVADVAVSEAWKYNCRTERKSLFIVCHVLPLEF